jgi:muconolactone delta-isomerase
MSLPFAAWLDIEVHPLASHPSDPGPPVGDTVEEH